MKRAHVAIVASVLVLLGSACDGSSDPTDPSDRPDGTSPESAEAEDEPEVVTVERTLPCDDVATIATALIGDVDSAEARRPGERFAPVPGAKKVAEATYFCGWSNEDADAVLRIYPDPLDADQAQRVWEGRTAQTSAYGGGRCTPTPSGFGDASLGVVCAYGPERSVLQVLGLFGDSLVECWHTRAETDLAVLAEDGMAFCQDVIERIGETGIVS